MKIKSLSLVLLMFSVIVVRGNAGNTDDSPVNECVTAEVLLENDWMYTSGEDAVLRVAVKAADEVSSKGISLAVLTDQGEDILT